MAKEAVPEPFACPVKAMELVSEYTACPVKKAILELPACLDKATEVVTNLFDRSH